MITRHPAKALIHHKKDLTLVSDCGCKISASAVLVSLDITSRTYSLSSLTRYTEVECFPNSSEVFVIINETPEAVESAIKFNWKLLKVSSKIWYTYETLPIWEKLHENDQKFIGGEKVKYSASKFKWESWTILSKGKYYLYHTLNHMIFYENSTSDRCKKEISTYYI